MEEKPEEQEGDLGYEDFKMTGASCDSGEEADDSSNLDYDPS